MSMTFLLGALKFLKAIPWPVWLLLGLALVGWRWHVNAVDSAVTEAVAEVRKEWAAENAQEDADAIKARDEWNAKLAERDAEITELKTQQVADSAIFLQDLAKARKAAANVNKGVARVTLENPIIASCALSDERLGLRNEAIRQANSAAGSSEAANSGLPGSLQDRWPGDSRIADWGTERDLQRGHFNHPSLWRVPAYTSSAG